MAGTARVKYFKYLLGKLEDSYRIRGGTHDAPFSVLEFSNPGDDVRGVPVGWYYVTDGVSDHRQPSGARGSDGGDLRVEIMLYCSTRCQRAIDLLERVANAPADEQKQLAPGQILSFSPADKCGWVGYGLFSVGDSCGSIAKPVSSDGTPIELLRLFPLLPEELEYGKRMGSWKLEVMLVSRDTNSRFDRRRNRAVTERDLARIDERTSRTPAGSPAVQTSCSTGSKPVPVAPGKQPVASPWLQSPPSETSGLAPSLQGGKDWMGQFYEDLKKSGTRRRELERAGEVTEADAKPAPDSGQTWDTSSEPGVIIELCEEARLRVERLEREAQLARNIAERTAASVELIEQSLQEARTALIALEVNRGAFETTGGGAAGAAR